MRLAFMGTPDFAVPSLAELIAAGHEIAAVYSQPPRPRGRGMVLTPSPVHAFADMLRAEGLEVEFRRYFFGCATGVSGRKPAGTA